MSEGRRSCEENKEKQIEIQTKKCQLYGEIIKRIRSRADLEQTCVILN